MIVTERISAAVKTYHKDYGLGFYTDKKTQCLYFYVCYYYSILGGKDWKIYRFNVNKVPLTWEFVGMLDIQMCDVGISSCGSYFWSIGITSSEPKSLYFRQVDIETLKHVDFEVFGSAFGEACRLERSHFWNTTYATFLFLYVTELIEGARRHVEYVYHLHVDMEKHCVNLERIHLPELSTIHRYPDISGYTHKKWRTALIEQNERVYFYRVDYLGDVHYVEWGSRTSSKWTKLKIKGDKRPKPWVISTDPNFDNHVLDLESWNHSLNLIGNCNRYYLSDGICYEYDSEKKRTDFFQLKLHVEDGICECVHMFEVIYWPSYEHRVSTFFNESTGSRFFLIYSRRWRDINSPYVWELMCINEVPTLRDLAYWTTRHHLIRKVETPVKSSFFDNIRRIVNVFTRRKKEEKEEEENPNWPDPNSFVHTNSQKAIVRVGRNSVSFLLKKFSFLDKIV
ncbi:hypothetical protein M3Y95_01188300 [Aphelenchoides besseyi]|nr:hypothetical protein M3Y95_01188300 [Aphelenchoides besseyi]